MLWKAIQVGITTVIPKVVEDLYKYLTTEDKKQDRSKYTESQTQEMVAMWKAWKDNPALYSNQIKFAETVNARFGTSKTASTIIKHIKKSL